MPGSVTPTACRAILARYVLGDQMTDVSGDEIERSRLGAIVNSTPIDIAAPPNYPDPGGQRFYEDYKNRTPLLYVGTDGGLLHAFFSTPSNVGAQAFAAGEEAFAILPHHMFGLVEDELDGGTRTSSLDEHRYGLASSPKAKSVCVANCLSDDLAEWKTVLVMGDGPGGQEFFALDITQPVSGAGFRNPPTPVLWHSRERAR